MVYTPPAFSTLKTTLARELRDAANGTFNVTELGDFLNHGIVEVNRVYPLMDIEEVPIIDTDEDGNVDRVYTITSREVSRVEVWDTEGFSFAMVAISEEANSGWDLWGTTLTVASWEALDADEHTLKLYGYQDRDLLVDDVDVAEFDADAEMAVRTFAATLGYQRLQNDRSLFQQWLAAPGNKDISPTQLDGIANTYLAHWNRQRNHLRTVRR